MEIAKLIFLILILIVASLVIGFSLAQNTKTEGLGSVITGQATDTSRGTLGAEDRLNNNIWYASATFLILVALAGVFFSK